MERVAPRATDQIVDQVHGKDRRFVIPAGRESFTIGNGDSVVRLFLNDQGEMQDILISD